MRAGTALSAVGLSFALATSGCAVKEKVEGVTSGNSSNTIIPRVLSFVASPSISLGNVPLGATRLVFVAISSTGSSDATVTSTSNTDSHFTYNGGTFPGTGGTCTQPIQGNCSVALLYTAPSSGGISIASNEYSINYSSGGEDRAITIALSANVTIAANLVVNGNLPLAFGTKNVGTSTDQTVTVANTGLVTASSMSATGLAAPMTFKGGTYPGTGGTCGTALTTGSTCTMVITYAPVSAGTTNKTLSLGYYDGGGVSTAAMAVSGTAVTLASLAITSPTASPFDFGSLVTTATGPTDQAFTIQNSGGQTATSLAGGTLTAPFSYKDGTYPGTGGDCGASLGSGASCTIVLSFQPTTAGSFTDTLSLSYGDGSTTASLTRGLLGTGVGPGLLAISNGLTYDYGSKLVGTSTDFSFTVTNSGTSSATSVADSGGLAAPFAYKGGSYPGTGGTCGATIAASSSCSIVVTFTPTTAGAANSTITLNYNDGGTATSASRNVTGTGHVLAVLSITSPTAVPYDFGTKTTNAAETDVTFTVQNNGNGAATSLTANGLAGPFLFKGGSYPGTGGTCGATLAAAASCTIIVGYAPTTAGTWTSTLNISYNDGVTTQSITRGLQGVAVSPALLTISDGPTYNYGSKVTGTNNDSTFTVTNSGGAAATALAGSGLSAPFTFKGGTFPGTGGTCTNGGSLAVNATCTLVVRYSPTATGLTSQTITVGYDDGGATTSSTRPITGTGIQVATLSVTNPAADPYDFGTATVGAAEIDVTLTVSNTGNGPASSVVASGLATPFLYAGGAYPGTGGTCGATLASSATCTLVVGFLPTSAGTWADSLILTYADGSGSNATLTHGVQGIAGTAAFLSISDGASYDFGTQLLTTSTDHTFTVTNTGGSTATSIVGSGLSDPLTFKGGTYPGTGGTCGTSLVAGASCFIVVNFSPTVSGGNTQAMTLTFNDGISSTHADRTIIATGGTVANLTISDGPTYYFPTTAKNYTAEKTLTVTNSGGATATSIVSSGLSAPILFKGGTYPGTGGTCGTSLAASGTCTMVVRFAPTSATTSTPTLTLTYNDSVNAGATSTLALSGVGATISAITGGAAHTCALYSTGIVKCWGSNSNGQLGDGSGLDQSSPVQVSGITTATAITAGSYHTCALLSNNRVMCWGADTNGQLGNDGTFADSGTPVQVATYTDFTQISAGGNLTCGHRSGNTIVCWGDNTAGGLANGSTSAGSGTPVSVTTTNTSMAAVAVGRAHACAYRSTGTTRCWGAGTSGQIGNNASNNATVTTTPSGAINNSAGILAGGDTSCVIRSTGEVDCWGADDQGQLGNDAAFASQDTPTQITALANLTAINFGMKHGCVKTATNTLKCWGSDSNGQLGDGGNTSQGTPVAVTGISNISIFGTGDYHTCTVLSSGSAYCWGSNSNGQLGDGNVPNDQSSPVAIQGL